MDTLTEVQTMILEARKIQVANGPVWTGETAWGIDVWSDDRAVLLTSAENGTTTGSKQAIDRIIADRYLAMTGQRA